jgi:ParB/RepB/Spo0J family partition protein
MIQRKEENVVLPFKPITRLKDAAITTKDAFLIDPRIIIIEPGFNIRDFSLQENIAHVRWLADSIKQSGVLQAITIRYVDGQVFLVDGECRVRAARLAMEEGCDLKGILALAESRGMNEAERVLSLITRNSGKNVNALEEAVAFARLLKFNWTEAEIAQKSGLSRAHIASRLMLHEAPNDLQRMIGEEKVSPTEAVIEIRAHGSKEATAVISEAVDIAHKQGKKKATRKHIDEAINNVHAKRGIIKEKVIPFDRADVIEAFRDIHKISTQEDVRKIVEDVLFAYRIELMA